MGMRSLENPTNKTLGQKNPNVEAITGRMAVIACCWGGGPDSLRVKAIRMALSKWSNQDSIGSVKKIFIEGIPDGQESVVADVLPKGTSHIRITMHDRHGNIMQKEALWNIGAKLADAMHCEVCAFIDADVWSEDVSWWTKIARRFSELAMKNVICFVHRSFVDTGDESVRRWSVGTIADPELNISRHVLRHPGHGFAARTELLREIGWINQYVISGSGDTMMCYELLPEDSYPGHMAYSNMKWWEGVYRKNLPRCIPTYVPVDVKHEHHGPFSERAYVLSRMAIDWTETPVSELVYEDTNGMMAWYSPKHALRKIMMDKARLSKDPSGFRSECGLGQRRSHSVFGWFDFHDCYRKFVRVAPEGSIIVELGTWAGKSASFLSEEIILSGKRIEAYTADVFPVIAKDHETWKHYQKTANGTLEDVARANVAASGGAVQVVKTEHLSFASRFNDHSVFAVWIDGDHTEKGTYNAIKAWWPKIMEFGWIGGHDYINTTYPGVKLAVDRWFLENGRVPTITGTSWHTHKVWYVSV